MQLNFIILAHKCPEQVRRLIQKLEAPDCFFYIHVDKNVSIDPFIKEMANIQNVNFVKQREEGIWGHIGIVQATINSMKQIVSDVKAGHCILLSGQDYPLKSNSDIKTYFKNHPNSEFIDVFPLPYKNWSKDRIEKYKFNLSNRKEDFLQIGSVFENDFFTQKTLKKIYRLIKAGQYDFVCKILKRRKYPSYILPYGGSQWWALTIDTVKKITEFIDNNPGFVKYHTYSLLPDEMFFQSIVMYLAEKNQEMNLMSFLTYANWERKNCDLPVTFTSNDFEELSSQPNSKLFARKFDIAIDEGILDKIDIYHSQMN
ncbi:beta-1,6-N-acetylglucosaminyltransferase [Flavobacterium sharifuzzamanii]|uniref:beta-1,6-N-acetylglucosaminyltransferase n=1 Tax=Flavobacterium sharifuzzamanii TaxID=2211133 RepID=UPI000DAE724A|nr:beta-1,6-N-acetylglucosaminyltransferase [Flavobacterium sharifuzzamanii]KAF2081181.1 beta-1,6-N-acetylglucosaminyltransferase [Flavobacterium sharifuzzamanii]